MSSFSLTDALIGNVVLILKTRNENTCASEFTGSDSKNKYFTDVSGKYNGLHWATYIIE